MMVTAQEGTYSVELQKGGIVGAKTVTVERDKQVTVDFTEYTEEAEKTGAVNFMVTPENAVMTIDGMEVDYSQPIQLSYGTHSITLIQKTLLLILIIRQRLLIWYQQQQLQQHHPQLKLQQKAQQLNRLLQQWLVTLQRGIQ